MTGLTLQSESDEATFPWTDLTPGDFQSDVSVDKGVISGSLAFIEGGLAESGPLAGDGYFIALKWSDPDETATSLKVGLVPSASGMDLIECIDDTDRNGVFKITDPANQKFIIVSSNDEHETKQIFKLTGIVFEEPAGEGVG